MNSSRWLACLLLPLQTSSFQIPWDLNRWLGVWTFRCSQNFLFVPTALTGIQLSRSREGPSDSFWGFWSLPGWALFFWSWKALLNSPAWRENSRLASGNDATIFQIQDWHSGVLTTWWTFTSKLNHLTQRVPHLEYLLQCSYVRCYQFVTFSFFAYDNHLLLLAILVSAQWKTGHGLVDVVNISFIKQYVDAILLCHTLVLPVPP